MFHRRKSAARAALVCAALLLSACRWGAVSPLVAGGEADASPLTAGEYAWTTDSQYYYSVQGAGTEPVSATYYGSEGATPYSVRFDLLDQEFYIVEASDSYESGVSYALIRVRPNGFDQVGLSCGAADQQIALSAGAVLDDEKACMFSSYASLRRAAEGVAAQIRAGGGVFPVTSYVAR